MNLELVTVQPGATTGAETRVILILVQFMLFTYSGISGGALLFVGYSLSNCRSKAE